MKKKKTNKNIGINFVFFWKCNKYCFISFKSKGKKKHFIFSHLFFLKFGWEIRFKCPSENLEWRSMNCWGAKNSLYKWQSSKFTLSQSHAYTRIIVVEHERLTYWMSCGCAQRVNETIDIEGRRQSELVNLSVSFYLYIPTDGCILKWIYDVHSVVWISLICWAT